MSQVGRGERLTVDRSGVVTVPKPGDRIIPLSGSPIDDDDIVDESVSSGMVVVSESGVGDDDESPTVELIQDDEKYDDSDYVRQRAVVPSRNSVSTYGFTPKDENYFRTLNQNRSWLQTLRARDHLHLPFPFLPLGMDKKKARFTFSYNSILLSDLNDAFSGNGEKFVIALKGQALQALTSYKGKRYTNQVVPVCIRVVNYSTENLPCMLCADLETKNVESSDQKQLWFKKDCLSDDLADKSPVGYLLMPRRSADAAALNDDVYCISEDVLCDSQFQKWAPVDINMAKMKLGQSPEHIGNPNLRLVRMPEENRILVDDELQWLFATNYKKMSDEAMQGRGADYVIHRADWEDPIVSDGASAPRLKVSRAHASSLFDRLQNTVKRAERVMDTQELVLKLSRTPKQKEAVVRYLRDHKSNPLMANPPVFLSVTIEMEYVICMRDRNFRKGKYYADF